VLQARLFYLFLLVLQARLFYIFLLVLQASLLALALDGTHRNLKKSRKNVKKFLLCH
jgi:hypothetical protein